jgi:hypothetical protein
LVHIKVYQLYKILMKKIYLLNYHFADNYGAVLQSYALKEFINAMGYNTLVLNYRPFKINESYSIMPRLFELIKNYGLKKGVMRFFYRFFTIGKRFRKHLKFERFRRTHLNMTKRLIEKITHLKCYDKEDTIFIVGSDQVWNHNIIQGYEAAYFLDFVNKKQCKVSYAASISEDVSMEFINYLNRKTRNFSSVSIREKSNLDFFELDIKNKVHVNIDPTLLFEKTFYDTLAKENKLDRKYILVYDMNNKDLVMKIANNVAKKYSYSIISFSKVNSYNNYLGSFYNYGPEEFVTLVKHSEFIISSSFHGTAFAIIYNKPFYSIPHLTRGNRMIDLLDLLGLEDRLLKKVIDDDEISLNIDYSLVNDKLALLREESLEYLQTSINDIGSKDEN